MENIKIFITGGTFDKEFDDLTGKLFFRETHVPSMLKIARFKQPHTIDTLMLIDSLEMTDHDRYNIAEHCKNTPENRIVITHGTDTMTKTAELLNNEIKDKTIILTGAMVPYKLGGSDALFNLGAALAFAQTLPPGVYTAMNGQCFKGTNVRKNKQAGEFEEV